MISPFHLVFVILRGLKQMLHGNTVATDMLDLCITHLGEIDAYSFQEPQMILEVSLGAVHKKIPLIKALRTHTPLGLKEAKIFIEECERYGNWRNVGEEMKALRMQPSKARDLLYDLKAADPAADVDIRLAFH